MAIPTGKPALNIACHIAVEHTDPLLLAERNVEELPNGPEAARLFDLPAASTAEVHVMLVDHREFREAPAPRRQIVNTRGVWIADCSRAPKRQVTQRL